MDKATDSDGLEKDADMKRLRDAVHVLAEHFCAVQIFATRYQDGYTLACHAGTGNHWARVGQIRKWITEEDETIRMDIRKDD